MRRFALMAIAMGFLAPVLASAPAHAQATRTWISGVGDDVNPCSRTAPCKTFAGAISKTAAAGEIDCLDPGGFGAVTITKSITLSCGFQNGGVLSSLTTGIIVNAAATDTIYIKGVNIQGAGNGVDGVRVLSAALVVVEDSAITGLTGVGIAFLPTAASKLVVNRVTITNAGGGGIKVRPTGGLSTASIKDATISKSSFGIQLDSAGGATGLNADIRDSTMAHNTNAGVQLTTSGIAIGALLTRVSSSFNGTGLQTAGANTFMRVGESSITGNATGISGTVSSFGTNELIGNGTDGALTLLPAPALK